MFKKDSFVVWVEICKFLEIEVEFVSLVLFNLCKFILLVLVMILWKYLCWIKWIIGVISDYGLLKFVWNMVVLVDQDWLVLVDDLCKLIIEKYLSDFVLLQIVVYFGNFILLKNGWFDYG